jgi:hypothetical protein
MWVTCMTQYCSQSTVCADVVRVSCIFCVMFVQGLYVYCMLELCVVCGGTVSTLSVQGLLLSVPYEYAVIVSVLSV